MSDTLSPRLRLRVGYLPLIEAFQYFPGDGWSLNSCHTAGKTKRCTRGSPVLNSMVRENVDASYVAVDKNEEMRTICSGRGVVEGSGFEGR